MKEAKERHDTFGYLEDPRLPENISASPVPVKKKVLGAGGTALMAGVTMMGLFGEKDGGSVISPALIAEKLNDKSHGIEVRADLLKPPAEVQPLNWESFLPSSDPDPEGLTPEDDEADPEDNEPDRTAGLSSPLSGGVEGVDYTKEPVNADDIQPGMELVAGDGIPARDEQTDGFPFLKDEADNLIILKEGEKLEVLKREGDFAEVRRVDGFTDLPKEERVVVVWVGPEGTTTKSDPGHQLWLRQASDGKEPVKDVGEGEVSEGQTSISIDYERLQEKVSLKDGQLCMDVNDLYHSLTTKGDNVQVLLENGKLNVLIGENGEKFIKSRAWYSDGRTIDIWVPAEAFEDNQLSELSNASVNQLSGFEVEDKRLDLEPFVEEQFLIPLKENEKQEIARRSSLNGVIPNKINDKTVDTFWLKGIPVKDYDYGAGNRAIEKGMNTHVDDAYKDPKENSPDFILSLKSKAYGPEKTIIARIDGRNFTMFRLLRNPSNDDWLRAEQTDWVLGDFFGPDVSFYLTDKDWERIRRFKGNPSVKELKIRLDSALVHTY